MTNPLRWAMMFLEVILVNDKDNGGAKNTEKESKSKEQLLWFETKGGERVKVECIECTHCKEIIPKVGTCADCQTQYEHWKTIEEEETGFLHFIYRCSGCIGDAQKAQKILKPLSEK